MRRFVTVRLKTKPVSIALHFLLMALSIAAGGVVPAGGEETVPYRDLSVADPGFAGPGRDAPAPEGLTCVRLGVIGPGRRPAGGRLWAGVALAVAEANARGGYGGLPYEAVFRPDDGPWGMGAKQVTALVCEDSVWAILGGLEGGDAHLAELVAAKLWAPVVTPTASDLTIDYANVPWMFRCFPSDARQARALIGYAQARGYRRLAVFAEGDREGRTGLARVQAAARRARFPLAICRDYAPHTPEMAVTAGDLRAADAVLIWGRSGSGLTLLLAMRQAGFDGPVLGPARLASSEWLGVSGDVVVAAPCDLSADDVRTRAFQVRYREATGEDPDPVALFAYDAACLVIAAVERAGLNRARIRDALAETDFEGVAGRYRFNGLGGAPLEPVLMTVREGRWVPLRTDCTHR